MAKDGQITLDLNFSDFERAMQTAISRAERGAEKAIIAACEEIKKKSLEQVPKDTETIAKSFFYVVRGSYQNATATIGYGGNGDPVNPKTGKRASEYMVKVHEDLEAQHPRGGKAKFFEDPLREYSRDHDATVALTIKYELERGNKL